MTTTEGGPQFLPRSTSAAVTLLRLSGLLWIALGWLAAIDIGSGAGAGAGVLVIAFCAAVGSIYFGAASGIRHRRFLAHVIGLVLAGMGVAYGLMSVGNGVSASYRLLLLVLLAGRPTREYVAADGDPAPRRRGPLSRLDDMVLGPYGTTSIRVRSALGRR